MHRTPTQQPPASTATARRHNLIASRSADEPRSKTARSPIAPAPKVHTKTIITQARSMFYCNVCKKNVYDISQAGHERLSKEHLNILSKARRDDLKRRSQENQRAKQPGNRMQGLASAQSAQTSRGLEGGGVAAPRADAPTAHNVFAERREPPRPTYTTPVTVANRPRESPPRAPPRQPVATPQEAIPPVITAPRSRAPSPIVIEEDSDSDSTGLPPGWEVHPFLLKGFRFLDTNGTEPQRLQLWEPDGTNLLLLRRYEHCQT